MPQVEPTDDHVIHLMILFGFLDWTQKHNQQVAA